MEHSKMMRLLHDESVVQDEMTLLICVNKMHISTGILCCIQGDCQNYHGNMPSEHIYVSYGLTCQTSRFFWGIEFQDVQAFSY